MLLAIECNNSGSGRFCICMSDISYTAKAILVLENYDGGDNISIRSILCNRAVAMKWGDLNPSECSMKRDLLKFFRKRIACSCLKKMHLEARNTMPKKRVCNHCKVEKERALLMVCSKCRVANYCSRKCQVADWQPHEIYQDAANDRVERL